MMFAALISGLLLAQTPQGQAPDPDDIEALQDEAEALEAEARARALEAEAARIEIARLQRRLVEAGERVRAREAEADAARTRLERLEAEETELLARLSAERAGLARVLAALQRIETADPPAIAVTPDDAAEAARAAGLLARIAPELERRVAAVNERLDALAALRERLSAQASALGDAREALALTREEVEALIEERRAAEARLRAEAGDLSRRARRIAQQAGDLRELLAEIRRFAAAEPRLAPRPEPAFEPEDGVPTPRLRPDRPAPAAARGALVDAAPLSGPEAEETELLARLSAERTGLARVLAALQRIETADPPAIAVTPDDAAEAARAAGLLARIAPELERRVAAVNERLDALAALRERLSAQASALGDAREALALTREEVEALIEERRAAEARLRAEAGDLSRRARRIAQQAGDLRELLAEIRRFAAAEPRLAPRPEPAFEPEDGVPTPRLRPDRPAPAAARGALVDAAPLSGPAETLRFTDMRGRLRPPVNGRLAVGAGEAGPDGSVRPGVWFETNRRAQVSAPFDGVVIYAGAFQGFGTMIMINTPDGFTLVLGGLALSYVSEGQSVLAGEPVGVAADRVNPEPMLYLGIRRSTDDAEDPEEWLRPEFRRGQG